MKFKYSRRALALQVSDYNRQAEVSDASFPGIRFTHLILRSGHVELFGSLD